MERIVLERIAEVKI